MRPATITNSLQRLERHGLVKRRPDADDARISRVHLTEAGRQIQGAVERTWGELEAQAFAGFAPQERSQLAGFLRRVQENLAPAKVERGCHR